MTLDTSFKSKPRHELLYTYRHQQNYAYYIERVKLTRDLPRPHIRVILIIQPQHNI